MRRRVANAEVKELLILSRSQKCCRFKVQEVTQAQKKSLSNLKNTNKKKKKISKESKSRKWVVLKAKNDEDSPKAS